MKKKQTGKRKHAPTPSTKKKSIKARERAAQKRHLDPLSSRKHRVHMAFAAALGAAPHFGAQAALVEQGRTANFIVSYDAGLGDAGPVIANYLIQACEYDYSRASSLFQVSPSSLPFEVSIVRSSAGAWHQAPCTNTSIGIGAITTNPPDALFLRSLMLSEVVEVLGGTLNNGWQCDYSNGEALSRVLADELVPCVKPRDFISGYLWLDSPRVDWVDTTEQTITQ
jgi:hypothetical protein